MFTVRAGLGVGLTADLVVLAGLVRAVGLDVAGGLTGVAVGLTVSALVARGLARTGRALGPADRVTLLRAGLVGGIAALVVDSRPGHVEVLVALASVALALDAVDGRVARRTRTESQFGARFDLEVDAFLILVLSIWDARLFGMWVLAIGAARYVFVAAGWAWPWLRQVTPARFWCKVVAAIQGITLAVVAADVIPRPLAAGLILVALALLVESFGREVHWLVRHRRAAAAPLSADVVIHA